MDRVVDLDQAAAEITSRLPAWTAAGLVPGPITWRDETAPWPQPLDTDRAHVADPDSVGVSIQGSDEWNVMSIVLFRGGWADLDLLVNGEIITECPQITTCEEFGVVLDSVITRLGGTDRPGAT